MSNLVVVTLTVVALLAGLALGYEIRDRRFIKEVRNEVRAEFAEQRKALADRIDELEDLVDGAKPNGEG